MFLGEQFLRKFEKTIESLFKKSCFKMRPIEMMNCLVYLKRIATSIFSFSKSTPVDASQS